MIRRSAHIEQALAVKVHVPGLAVLRRVSGYLKPTGAILQLAGHLVSRNALDLSEEELSRLLEKGHIADESGLEEGYVMIRAGGVPAGCGLILGGRLLGRFPKWFRAMYKKYGVA